MAISHRSHAYAARGRMLSGCRISGGALSVRIYDPRPIGSIRPVRYRLLGFEPIRQGREGVGRPRRLSADAQDRRSVSGTIGHWLQYQMARAICQYCVRRFLHLYLTT